MEFITEFSEQIRWFSAVLLYPIALFITPRKGENGYKIRRFLYLIALPIFCINYGLGSIVNDSYIGLHQQAIIAFKVVMSLVRAIVITEVIRSMAKNNMLWSTKKHYIILATLAILLTAINISTQ